MVNLITEKTAIKPTLSPYLQTYVTPPVQEEPKVAPVQAPIQPVEVSDNSNHKNKLLLPLSLIGSGGILLYFGLKNPNPAKMYKRFVDGKLFEMEKRLRTFTASVKTRLNKVTSEATQYIEDYKVRMNQEYISDSSYPVEAAAWIKENLDLTTLKLYNEYNYGSYLLLNDIPVFIDSRCDLYTPEFNRNTGHGASGKDIFSDAINIANRSANYENDNRSTDLVLRLLFFVAMRFVNCPTISSLFGTSFDGCTFGGYIYSFRISVKCSDTVLCPSRRGWSGTGLIQPAEQI